MGFPARTRAWFLLICAGASPILAYRPVGHVARGCSDFLRGPRPPPPRSMRVGRVPVPTRIEWLYGDVVGNFPAVSSASRFALSLVSCVAFSFGLNVPLGGAPSGGPCIGPPPDVFVGPAGVLVGVVVVAAPLDAAPNTVAPMAPPANSELA